MTENICITLLSFLVQFSTTYLSKKQRTHLNPDSVGEQQQLELMEFWKCEQQEEIDGIRFRVLEAFQPLKGHKQASIVTPGIPAMQVLWSLNICICYNFSFWLKYDCDCQQMSVLCRIGDFSLMHAPPPTPCSRFPTQFTPSSVTTCVPKLTEGCQREWESRCESSGTRAAIKDVPIRRTEDCCDRYKRISQKWRQNVHGCFWSRSRCMFHFCLLARAVWKLKIKPKVVEQRGI